MPIDPTKLPTFPQAVCSRGEEGSCGFVKRGLGWTCAEGDACQKHVAPGEPFHAEITAYYRAVHERLSVYPGPPYVTFARGEAVVTRWFTPRLCVAQSPDSPVAWVVLERRTPGALADEASDAPEEWAELEEFSDVAGGHLAAWAFADSRVRTLREIAGLLWGGVEDDVTRSFEDDLGVYDSSDAADLAAQLDEIADVVRGAGVARDLPVAASVPPDVWIKVAERDVPRDVRFNVPRENQGQMVEVAYGTDDARYADPSTARWKREVDRSIAGPFPTTGPGVEFFRRRTP